MSSGNQFYPYDEKALVQMAAKGDLDTFNQLVLNHQDVAYNHAYALLGDSALAEDATQESFLKGFQAIGDFRGGSFRAWILRIVSNTAYDLLRTSTRHPTQPLFPEHEEGDEVESPAWLADPSLSVEGIVEQHEESNRLYRLLDQLPDAYRSAITLVDLYGLDYTEAAQALNVPIGTLKSRLARARLQIQKKLKGSTDDERNPTCANASLAG